MSDISLPIQQKNTPAGLLSVALIHCVIRNSYYDDFLLILFADNKKMGRRHEKRSSTSVERGTFSNQDIIMIS